MYENNKELIAAARAGSGDALEKLVRLNMGLVKSIASRFRDRGAEFDDLVQIGTIGMLKAIRSFDESYNTEFSTYAVPLIIGEIRRFLRDDGTVKVGRSIKRRGIDAMRKQEAFIREHGREPKLSELAELCQISCEELSEALDAASPVHSLNESVGEDEGTTLEGVIADRDDRIGKMTDSIALREAIMSLPELQRKLIVLRYYKELSQQKTGEILKMTQVKVSREEKKIIEKLRKAISG